MKTEIKPEDFGLETKKATEMVGGLSVTLAERDLLRDNFLEVSKIEVTKENQSTFKELRLKIVKNRTQGLKSWHTSQKAFFLTGGRFVDAVYNKEVLINEEMESKLLEAEKFFENLEKEKARLLNLERIEKVRPFVEDADNMNFAEFSDYDFEDFVLGKKTRFENEQKAKIEAEQKAEAERIAEIERQKAIEVENAKLKKEAEAKEKQLQKEREEAKEKQDAIELKVKQERDKAEKERQIEANKQKAIQDAKDAEIKKERAAREKLESDAKANAKLEANRIAAEKLEAEKLAKAPIKKQLSFWVESFNHGLQPVENETTKEILAKFESFKKWAKTEINKL